MSTYCTVTSKEVRMNRNSILVWFSLSEIWIGLSTSNGFDPNSWRWLDGTELTIGHWDNGDITQDGQLCGRMITGLHNRIAYICEDIRVPTQKGKVSNV